MIRYHHSLTTINLSYGCHGSWVVGNAKETKIIEHRVRGVNEPWSQRRYQNKSIWYYTNKFGVKPHLLDQIIVNYANKETVSFQFTYTYRLIS